MKLFLVTRPYCSPEHVLIRAEDKAEAIKITHANYGFCTDTVARHIKTKRIVVALNLEHRYKL